MAPKPVRSGPVRSGPDRSAVSGPRDRKMIEILSLVFSRCCCCYFCCCFCCMYLIMYFNRGAQRLPRILSNNSRPGQQGQQDWGPRPVFFRSWTVLLARLALSVGLFASCERFALELGLSDLDFARLDSPRDGLDVVFGS